MQIIDAHHHFWCPVNDTAQINYVWLKKIGAPKPFGDPTPIQRDYLPAEYLSESKEHKIIGSVHVQADGAMPDPVREAQWLERLQADSGLPSAHVGFIDLTAADCATTLERYRHLPGFRGVRQILSRLDERPELSFVPEHYLHNPTWREQFGLLADHALSFDLQLYPQQMAEAAAFLAAHENVPVIIDHAGSPYDQSPAGFAAWRAGIAELAALPHCTVKLSGFGMFDPHWSADTVQPLIDALLELFGPQRLLFGSNFPVDKLMHRYDVGVNALLTCLNNRGLDDSAITQVFCDNARRIYRL